MVSAQPANRRHEDQVTDRWLAYVGDCPKVTDYINHRNSSTGWAVIKFLNALFRGYGQVVFANNPFSGALVMIALFWADFAVGLKGLFTSTIALLVSIILRYPKEVIENGLTAFNPLLLGQVCGALLPARFGIEFELQHWFYLAVGAIFTLFVTAALSSLLGSIGEFPIPCLALPFCVVQFLFFVTAVHLESTKVVPYSLNSTGITTNTDITLPSASDFDQVSGALKMVVSDVETTEESQLSSVDLSTIQHFSTLSIKSSTTRENVTQKTNMEAEVLELQTTTSTNPYADTDTTLAMAGESLTVTEAQYTAESVVTESDNITQYTNNNSVVNQTEKNTRHKRNSDSQSRSGESDEVVETEPVNWGQVFSGIILSMTQVYGACHVPGAVLMYLGVLIYSPITAGFSLAGAIIATVAGIGLSSAPYELVYNGVWGFNGLLTGAALSFFFVVTWQSVVVTIVSVLFTAVLQNLLMLSLEESNLPVVSIPFNLTAMLFLCLGPDANGRGLVRPQALSFPEKQRAAYLQRCGQDQEEKASVLPLNVQEDLNKEKRAPLAEQEVV